MDSSFEMGNCGRHHNFSTRDSIIVEKKRENRSRERKGVVNLKIEWVENLSMTVE